MMTISAMVAGAVLFASGGVAGSIVTALFAVRHVRDLRGKLDRARSRPPENVCECGHSAAMHDPNNGACHAQVERNDYNAVGDVIGRVYVLCTCRQYVGPGALLHIRLPELPTPSIPAADKTEV